MNNFRGDLSGISAKKEALMLTPCVIPRPANVFHPGTLLVQFHPGTEYFTLASPISHRHNARPHGRLLAFVVRINGTEYPKNHFINFEKYSLSSLDLVQPLRQNSPSSSRRVLRPHQCFLFQN